MSLLLALDGIAPPAPTEKFFFGTKTGNAYMLSGTKLFNITQGTVTSIENNTDFIIDRSTGKLMWKLTNMILDNA